MLFMAVLYDKTHKVYYVDTKIKKANGLYYHFKHMRINDKKYRCKRYVKSIENDLISLKKKELSYKNLKSKKSKDIQELLAKFISYKSVDLRESTIRSYLGKIRLYIYPHLKKFKTIYKALSPLSSDEFRKEISKLSLDVATKNKILHIIKEIIIYARFLKLIDSDTRDDSLFILKYYKEELKVKEEKNGYTPLKDLKKVIKVTKDPNLKDVFVLLYFSGCRISEFLGLKLKDVIFYKDKAEIKVVRQLGMRCNETIDALKTKASYKKITYSKKLKDILKRYIERNNLDEEDFLFNYSRPRLKRKLDEAFLAANVKKNTFHGFGRKSINTELYYKTHDVKLCQSVLGQKSSSVNLNHYIDNELTKKKTVSAIDSLLDSIDEDIFIIQ